MTPQTDGTIRGRVLTVERSTVGQKQTDKAVLVIETPPHWKGDEPQMLPVEFFSRQAKEVPAALAAGCEVEIGYTLRGSEWKGKYYPKISGQTCRAMGALAPAPAAPSPAPYAPPAAAPFPAPAQGDIPVADDSEMPF